MGGGIVLRAMVTTSDIKAGVIWAGAVGKPVELFIYKGDNHNVSVNFARAMARSIRFFDTHVKGAEGN